MKTNNLIKDNCTVYGLSLIVESLLGDWNNKKIIDIGCGSSLNINKKDEYSSNKEYFPVFTSLFHGFLNSRKVIPSEKNLTLIGFDYGFLDKSENYLKKFEEKFNFKPVAGDISKIDSILEDKFDIVMSSCFFGHPTTDLNPELIMKKLYKITKKDGYHCHFKIKNEPFYLSKESIENLGFKILHYFDDDKLYYQPGLNSILILQKN